MLLLFDIFWYSYSRMVGEETAELKHAHKGYNKIATYPFTTSQIGSLRYDTADLPISKLAIDKHGGAINVRLEKSNELIINISLPV